ncbi:cobalt-precorrin-5B (C(1))-methyltransferase [Anaerobacillus sp. MEB173]|uniref:cobalt-precorrin-5B (C(1))-methyltransferase n=1 Tax=Anaerobacillus sp. MEB173 TaxID=3383345 RepID=UPI003F922F62
MTKETKKLRHGYTTGANATAASKAALLSLLLQKEVKQVQITLPRGEKVLFTMEQVRFTDQEAEATVIKDGGDDPDATHLAKIVSTVSFRHKPGVFLEGGIGVGRVTKPGLPVPVGEPAINPVPRHMIKQTVIEVLHEYECPTGVNVTISVPDGEEIAKKTLNGRLGIIGGISILGTRGIVVPFSTSAYKASIVRAISVAVEAAGCSHVILSTGGRSEKFGMTLYPEHAEEAFIEMGEFVGFSLKQCKKAGIKKATLIGMIGKFSKVAQGVMMVHSKSAPINFEFLANVAKEVGVPTCLLDEVRGANTASQVADMMMENGYSEFFNRLCHYACKEARKEVGDGLEVEVILMTMKNELLGRETIS